MTGQVVAVVHLLQPSLRQQDFQGVSHIRGIHAAVGYGAYLQLMQVIQQGGFCQIVMQGELAEDGGEMDGQMRNPCLWGLRVVSVWQCLLVFGHTITC
ncbi:hypothetical protein [Serratia liquefaciens]|uniref:hypothetical protein n=1 Tax=Serratia liquefaciens TaxID=614 RepID=UPI003905AE77